MLNFAQLSATLNLRAVMEKTHGAVDEALLGRLQNSAKDRNWDSIEALWEMKKEVRDDAELRRAFAADDAAEIIAALRATDRGRRFIAERIEPYQREFGWHAVWSHEFIFPTVREQMEPVVELVRGYLETDYDYPSRDRARCATTSRPRRARSSTGLTGEALEEMRAANEVNLRMAPLTPDHHFYIDQGANAHVRLVLIAIGRKLVEARPPRRARRRDVPALQRAARVSSATRRRSTPGRSWPPRGRSAEAAERLRPRDWVGTVTPAQLAFPYLVNWGFPEKFHRTQSDDAADDHRARRVAGRRRGHRPRRPRPSTSSTRSAPATSSSAR